MKFALVVFFAVVAAVAQVSADCDAQIDTVTSGKALGFTHLSFLKLITEYCYRIEEENGSEMCQRQANSWRRGQGHSSVRLRQLGKVFKRLALFFAFH